MCTRQQTSPFVRSSFACSGLPIGKIRQSRILALPTDGHWRTKTQLCLPDHRDRSRHGTVYWLHTTHGRQAMYRHAELQALSFGRRKRRIIGRVTREEAGFTAIGKEAGRRVTTRYVGGILQAGSGRTETLTEWSAVECLRGKGQVTPRYGIMSSILRKEEGLRRRSESKTLDEQDWGFTREGASFTVTRLNGCGRGTGDRAKAESRPTEGIRRSSPGYERSSSRIRIGERSRRRGAGEARRR